MTRITRIGSLFLAVFAGLLVACVSEPRTHVVAAAQSSECVVLLHGLNRSWRAMKPLAEALQEEGFSTANVDYPSQLGTIEELAPVAVRLGLQECRATGANVVHFVTHSMGGILLRYEQQREKIDGLGRVVMLGPPNQGSELVDITEDWPGIETVNGKAGMQLGTDPESMPSKLGPVDFDLGVIAGIRTINILASAMLPDEDDGKVTIERTKVQGMNDFLIVEDSHRYMLRSSLVVRNTAAFLRTGHFLDEDRKDGPAELL
jgi:pimeloyl-ACP methyl ester carboxylesterase